MFDDGFVGQGRSSLEGVVVRLLEEVLPGCLDVGWVAVVGLVEDLEADVVVASGVGESVEYLFASVVNESDGRDLQW